MDVKTFVFALHLTFGVILDDNFHSLIENVTLVPLVYYYVDYFSNLDYFRYIFDEILDYFISEHLTTLLVTSLHIWQHCLQFHSTFGNTACNFTAHLATPLATSQHIWQHCLQLHS